MYALRQLGRPLAEQQAVVDEALVQFSGAVRAEFVGWQGRLRLENGDAAGAHEALSACLAELAAVSGETENPETGSSGATADLPEFYAADAQALLALGQQDTAEKQAIAALVSNPYTEEALLVLSACQPDAKTLLDCVLPLYPSEAKGASFLGSAVIAWVKLAGGTINIAVASLAIFFALGFLFLKIADKQPSSREAANID